MKNSKKQLYGLAYKLSHDAIFLLFLGFMFSILIESLLPGQISQNYGFLAILLAIFITLNVSDFFGKMLGIGSIPNKKNGLIPLAIIAIFILIGNSLIHFSFWKNLLITTISAIIFLLFYSNYADHEA